MIGLALVAMALTVGESVKAQFRSTLESSVDADYLVTDDAGVPSDLEGQLVATGVTDTITTFHYDEALVALTVVPDIGADAGGNEPAATEVLGTDLAKLGSLFDIDVTDGVGVDTAVTDPVLISDESAEAQNLAVGDIVAMTFPSGAERDLTVIGVYADDFIMETDYVLDRSTWAAVEADESVAWMALSLAEGVTIEEADAAFAPLASDYPQTDIETSGDFVRSIEGQIDQLLASVNVMVALAVIIALIGIANTLALSVFERTRELGLLRAIGMTRRQLRRMVRLEAGLVALFGATLGVTLGVLFGWAAVVALPASVTSTLAVPTTRILILVAIAGVAGLVAAWGPARRAGRLNVLDAIAV